MKLDDLTINVSESPIENSESYSVGDLLKYQNTIYIKLESQEVVEFILGCEDCINALEANSEYL